MKINLSKLETKAPKFIEKEEIKAAFAEQLNKIALLPAKNEKSLLIIFQGIDASGKDGVIRKVFSTINDNDKNIVAFKVPTEEEKKHDFLWRAYRHFPATGCISIHNRSYYEDVIMPLLKNNLPERVINNRIKLINAVEKNLVHNNTRVLKFFLHISEKEQKERIEERRTNPEKQWKYQPEDELAMKKYDEYLEIYEKIFQDCSKSSVWNIVPSDKKWYRNFLVANVLIDTLEKMNEEN